MQKMTLTKILTMAMAEGFKMEMNWNYIRDQNFTINFNSIKKKILKIVFIIVDQKNCVNRHYTFEVNEIRPPPSRKSVCFMCVHISTFPNLPAHFLFCLSVSQSLWLSLSFCIFGMAAMLFLCNGNLLFQGNLPGVLPVTIFKYASCLISYIVLFFTVCGERPSLGLKIFINF